MNLNHKRVFELTVTKRLRLGTQASMGDSGQALSLLGYLAESSTDAITAGTTQTQAGATVLTSEVNRINTVTTSGDGVKLPPSVAGVTILVINHGANPMQVYGTTPDTINDVATATGVSQMPNSAVLYICPVAGKWYSEGLATGFANGLQTLSTKNAITAFASGGQASAVALTAMLNRVTVCATAGDSVALPTSVAGMEIVVVNDGAAACDIFPVNGGSDTINGQAATAAVRLKPGGVATFYSEVAGTWNASLPTLRFVSSAASAAVATQAETIFATNQYATKAGEIKAGSVIKIRGSGTVTTANGTLDIRVRYGGVGGVLLMDTGAAITPVNGDQFFFNIELTCTDVGATGHVYGNSQWAIGTANTATMRFNKTASIAIDTTTSQVICATQQNGTGAGSITLDYLSVDII